MPYQSRISIPLYPNARRMRARGFDGDSTESLIVNLGADLYAALAGRDDGAPPTRSEFWASVRAALGTEQSAEYDGMVATRIADGGVALLPRKQLQDAMVGDRPVPWNYEQAERPPLPQVEALATLNAPKDDQ